MDRQTLYVVIKWNAKRDSLCLSVCYVCITLKGQFQFSKGGSRDTDRRRTVRRAEESLWHHVRPQLLNRMTVFGHREYESYVIKLSTNVVNKEIMYPT